MKPQNEAVSVIKKVGVYCRVSTREQAVYGYGIEVQKSKIQGYIDLFDIYPTTVDYFIDEGISAKNMNRKEMKRLLEAVKAKEINVIIIYKLDRLSRNVMDVYDFIETLQTYECNLISVMDNIDIYTATGRMLVGLLAIIAQWERETVIERTMDGLTGSAEAGKYPISHTPLGYIREDNHLLIDPIKSKIIIKIFELACAGTTIKEIERYMIENYPEDAKEVRGVKKILMRKLYYGYFEYHGTVYTNTVPAIINKDIYDKAQQVISKRFKVNDSKKYWFGNKAKCICGEILDKVSTRKKTKKYFYYYCKHCNKRINQDKLLFQVLPEIYEHYSLLNHAAISRSAASKIKAINAKMNEQYEAYLLNKIGIKAYVMTMSRLNMELEAFESIKESQNLATRTEWTTLSDQAKSKFISGLLENVVIDLDLQRVVKMKMIKEKAKK